MKGRLTLTLLSPHGVVKELDCDSIKLCVTDGEDGRGGGSYGIRPGHLRSVFLLASGELVALSDGVQVLRESIDGGFASVDADTVTVLLN